MALCPLESPLERVLIVPAIERQVERHHSRTGHLPRRDGGAKFTLGLRTVCERTARKRGYPSDVATEQQLGTTLPETRLQKMKIRTRGDVVTEREARVVRDDALGDVRHRQVRHDARPVGGEAQRLAQAVDGPADVQYVAAVVRSR